MTVDDARAALRAHRPRWRRWQEPATFALALLAAQGAVAALDGGGGWRESLAATAVVVACYAAVVGWARSRYARRPVTTLEQGVVDGVADAAHVGPSFGQSLLTVSLPGGRVAEWLVPARAASIAVGTALWCTPVTAGATVRAVLDAPEGPRVLDGVSAAVMVREPLPAR